MPRRLVLLLAIAACRGDAVPPAAPPPPPARDAAVAPPRTRVLATFTDELIGNAKLAVDATHAYLAIPESGALSTRVVRVATAGGPVELVARLDFPISDLQLTDHAMLVSGDRVGADGHRAGVIGELAKAPGAPFVERATDRNAIVELARSGDELYALVNGQPRRVAGRALPVLGKITDVGRFVADDRALFVLKGVADTSLWLCDRDGVAISFIGSDGFRAWSALALGPHDVYVVTRTAVMAFDRDDFPRGREETIEDLKRPEFAVFSRGVVIATQGDIAHIPGYDGAVILAERGRPRRVIDPHGADRIAADDANAYVLRHGQLIALAFAP